MTEFQFNRRNRMVPKKKRTKIKQHMSGQKGVKDGFLQSPEWKRLRYWALLYYGRKCMCCGATPADGAVMNVDHIKPRKKYPKMALDKHNLQVLCGDCNHGKGNWDETDWRPVPLKEQV